VQTAFVPKPEPIVTPAAHVLGTWQPTSRCGGDWWGCYALPGGRSLVVIGDVTGSGVAAAMVTAAAKGACDVAVRVMGEAFDLGALLGNLDGAVRRVGAGRFHLTCFAAIVDAQAGEVRFANAGHVVPYVCRPAPGGTGAAITLNALVARGNPLGAGTAPLTRTATRAIAPGDVIVWYTDGLVECRGHDGNQFGDRRLQRALRKLDPEHLDPTSVVSFIAAELAAHLGGLPPGDDMTLVVARVEAPQPAS
jgi:serine phosphatase RsbU (regulator of sigma subunit)